MTFYTEGTWIRFVLDTEPRHARTQVWVVETKGDGRPLGTVKWFGRWRKYIFSPLAMTVYEEVCLREIAAFCEARTAEHRASVKASKVA